MTYPSDRPYPLKGKGSQGAISRVTLVHDSTPLPGRPYFLNTPSTVVEFQVDGLTIDPNRGGGHSHLTSSVVYTFQSQPPSGESPHRHRLVAVPHSLYRQYVESTPSDYRLVGKPRNMTVGKSRNLALVAALNMVVRRTGLMERLLNAKPGTPVEWRASTPEVIRTPNLNSPNESTDSGNTLSKAMQCYAALSMAHSWPFAQLVAAATGFREIGPDVFEITLTLERKPNNADR
jgi:hypothetical protein